MARAMARWDRQMLLALGSAAALSCTNANAALPIEHASSTQAAATATTPPGAITYDLDFDVRKTNGTDTFYKWVNGQGSKPKPEWADVDRTTARKCDGNVFKGGNALCNLLGIKFKKLDVWTQASKDAYQLDLASVPPMGAVMTWIRVVEDAGQSDDRYGFKRGFDYYVVVVADTRKDPSGYDAGKWFLVRIDARHMQSLADSGMFRRCANEDKPTASDAAFTKCSKGDGVAPTHPHVRQLLMELRVAQQTVRDQQSAGQPTTAAEAEVKRVEAALAKELIDQATGPAWVSCTHGCCIAGDS